MSQYSNEFRSIIKQLRKISANTCAESEQMPYYEKEVCGTLPDVEGQTDQFTLIRVYTRDIDTGQIVLSHYEDTLGNIISGTVVEACCDSAVCGPPFTCAANIVGLSVDMEEGGILLDITGTTMTGYLQWMVDGVVQETFPNPGINTLLIDIASEIIAGGITISLLVGNNVDMDMYCMFSFETLADMNADIKEVGENPNWNPFPALTAELGCTGTLTYTLIIDATGNGVTVDYLTGELTLPAGIYDSYAFVEVRCDGVLVAVAGLQLLNEAPVQSEGFELTWNDIANSPFVTHTDLNTFINGNGGAANYTSVVTVGNVQTFYGGTAVDLGDNFMDGNASIVSIRDEAFQVVAQGTRGQSSCDALTLIALPALVVQTSDCQSSNAVLTSLNLQALTTQTSGNQSSNAAILAISLPSLTTQTDSNQSNNTLLTAITLPLLTTQVGAKEAGNQSSNPALLSLLLPSLTTQATENQRSNAVLPTISLPALTTQADNNQAGNAALTTISLPSLTTQMGGNQSNNMLLTSVSLPNLATQGSANQTSNASIVTLTLPALTTQSSLNQNTNALMTSLSLPVLATQDDENQSHNASLVTLSLPALTAQVGTNQNDNTLLTSITANLLTIQNNNNQSNNPALTTFTANALTTQINGNQTNNTLLTTITTPALTSIGTGNYVGCTYNIMTINVDASLFGAADILLAQAGGATII
jgi:hypothetical protein